MKIFQKNIYKNSIVDTSKYNFLKWIYHSSVEEYINEEYFNKNLLVQDYILMSKFLLYPPTFFFSLAPSFRLQPQALR